MNEQRETATAQEAQLQETQLQTTRAPYVRPQLERLGHWKQLTESQSYGSGRPGGRK